MERTVQKISENIAFSAKVIARPTVARLNRFRTGHIDIDDCALHAHALIIMQDTGMRPEEVFRIRVENIDWTRRLIFNPGGKTKAARRHVPISERMQEILMFRCSGKQDGWLFPSRRAAGGHLTTVAKQSRDARSKAHLPELLVLYCARHTFGPTA